MTENVLDILDKLDKPTKVGETEEGVNLYLDEPTLITVRDDRHRQKFTRKPLDQLIDSMRDVGQLQPGLCRWNEEDQIELLVGERRLRACIILKKKFLYIMKDELKDDPLLLEQAQLDENLVREGLTWQEEVMAKKRLHEILTERFGEAKPGVRGGHKLQDTAEYIGSKLTAFSEDVTLATFLTVPEVAAAKNKTIAKKTAKQLIDNVKRHEALTLAIKKEEKPKELTEEERAERKLESMRLLDKLAQAGKSEEEAKAEVKKIMEEKEAKSEQKTTQEQQLIYFNKKCVLGSMEDHLIELDDLSFDVVCFDPPWGVEFDKVFKYTGTTKKYEDNAEAYFELLPGWLKIIYDRMAEDSHLYMFFSITNHEFVYNALSLAGFAHNKMPLIWHKKGAHTTRNPTIWPGRSYEPIAYARKGNKPLTKQGAPDVIITPMPTPSIKDIHPSAKHPQVYKELLERSCKPGDSVLDPMAGSGMFGVAAESIRDNYALDWLMIEIDQDFKNLQLVNLMKGYTVITGESGNMKPLEVIDPATIKGFEQLTPGTPEWGQYFREHPDEQDAMLEWRQKMGK